MQPLPISLRITAIDRLRKIEGRIAAGNEITVVIGDVAAGICIDRVVRRISAYVHHFPELIVIFQFGSGE